MAGFKDEVSALLTCGDNVVAASADRRVRIFKFKDRTVVRALEHPASVMSLACFEPTHRLSTGCFDGTVTVWDLEKGTVLKQFLGFPMATQPKKPK
jgi:WD40 repeat protein